MTTPPKSEPPNEPPSREAVEAAMKIAHVTTKQEWADAAYDLMEIVPAPDGINLASARILAAEVQRLRALVDEPQGKQVKPGPDKPVTEPDLYCGACGQPSVQSLWFKAGHTATCPACGAEFVCNAGQ